MFLKKLLSFLAALSVNIIFAQKTSVDEFTTSNNQYIFSDQTNVTIQAKNATDFFCTECFPTNASSEELALSTNEYAFSTDSSTTNLSKYEEIFASSNLNDISVEDSSGNDTYDNNTMSPEEYLESIKAFIYPKTWAWVLIAFHTIVFIVGLVGNTLVGVAVYRNHSMRTVTNYFIVNLSVADFLVILFCLPPTVIWDVTSTWFFGTALCKVVLYLQVSCFYNIASQLKYKFSVFQ